LSDPKVLPKEQLTAYQRWELSPFENAAANAPTAQQMQALQQQAYQEAYQSGLADARQAMQVERKELQNLLQNINQSEALFSTELCDEILDLAIKIAEQMVRTSLQVRPDILVGLVREALESMPKLQQPPKLLLHPKDAELLRSVLQDQPDLQDLIIVNNEQTLRGSVKLITQAGELDATSGTRWKKILQALGQPGEWLDAPATKESNADSGKK